MIKLSKRVITLILLLIICLTAVSCGKKQEYEASVVFKVRIIETPDDLPEGVQMYQFRPIYADDYVEMLDDSIINKGEFCIYDNEYLFQIYSMLSLNVEERILINISFNFADAEVILDSFFNYSLSAGICSCDIC